jgi:uncharacterized caspase-like protein
MLWQSTAQAGEAAPPVYVIAVGSNDAPKGNTQLSTLKYADDDAAAVFELSSSFATKRYLLTVLDKRSQRRYPKAASAARPASLKELEIVVGLVQKQMAKDKRAGKKARLIFYFSGHGLRARAKQPSMLHLPGGGITRKWLYDRLFGRVDAGFVHVLVDACHAETVIRPRDGSAGAKELSARVVDLDHNTARRWVKKTTLARFPHVGAIIATSAGDQAHEWDAYEQGIFTHQVLSGLRGAADVNGDKRIV